MGADYWLKSSRRTDPGKYSELIKNLLPEYTPRGLVDVCSSQMQHTDMVDYCNLIGKDDSGHNVSLMYNERVQEKYAHLNRLPTTFDEIMEWMYDGEDAVTRYSRPEGKRGFYFGKLATFEKVPAQCMLICILAEGVLKTLGTPARLRVGFVKPRGKEERYWHHSELQYFDEREWRLEDPTTAQKKKYHENMKEDVFGFKRIDSLKGRIREPDFIYAIEAARLVKEANGEDERKEMLGRFVKRDGEGDENFLYDRLSRAMLDDFFALRNDAVVQMALEDGGYWYRGRLLSPGENSRETFELMYDELKDIATPEPDSETVMNKSDIAHYTLKPGKI